VVDGSGVRFTSANDAAASVVIEENGPVRAVVRASGTLKNASGTRLCEYLVRLHFYRGKSYTRAWISLRNARAASPTAFTFKNAEVVVPMAPGPSLRFTTATSRGTVSDALASGETMYLYQAYSTKNGLPENAYANAPMVISGTTFAQNGVEVRKVGGTIYQALTGSPADYAAGWASLEDGTGRGVTIGMRWMSALWPAGLELAGDGRAKQQDFDQVRVGRVRDAGDLLRLPRIGAVQSQRGALRDAISAVGARADRAVLGGGRDLRRDQARLRERPAALVHGARRHEPLAGQSNARLLPIQGLGRRRRRQPDGLRPGRPDRLAPHRQRWIPR
jgi:hypothetical protein